MTTNEKVINYISKRNLVNRVYDMLEYFGFSSKLNLTDEEIEEFMTCYLQDVYFVETLAKYFETRLKKKRYKTNIDLKVNLNQLINDLNYLKQYLDD